MYNRKWKAWESAKTTEALLLWCKESFNRENPEALFLLADAELGKADHGKETADAVYRMERAAKLGYVPAELAMGQLFQYGWAVHRNVKKAKEWYEKAAASGNAEAQTYLEALRKAKIRRVFAFATVFLFCAAAIFCVWTLTSNAAPDGVIVHEDTILLTPISTEEFQQALNQLVTQYDDELVVSGQRSSNRLLLMFEGTGVDLSDFPAAVVIADQDNYLVVQFATEEEAQRCLDFLQTMDNVLFANMDAYLALQDAQTDVHTTTGIPYVSPYSGEAYYSWGVEYMGLDRLSAWVRTLQTETVTVAVLDTGFEPCDENRAYYLDGIDLNDPSANAWTDDDGHGTHVAGTIIDCVWGLNVQILPIRVFLPGENAGAPESYVVEGLRYAVQNGADVINLSLGGSCAATDPDDTCGSAKDYFVSAAVANNIVVVTAAGNGDEFGNPEDACAHCPAHMRDAIVVAACDSAECPASFSNYGEAVDVTAPGVDITSYFPGDTFAELSGTSMAAPHVSALAAMLKLYLPDRTPAQIEKYVKDYCTAIVGATGYGSGIPWAGYFAGE